MSISLQTKYTILSKGIKMEKKILKNFLLSIVCFVVYINSTHIKLYGEIKKNQKTPHQFGAQVYQFQFDYTPNMNLKFFNETEKLIKLGYSKSLTNNRSKNNEQAPIFEPQFDKRTFPILRSYIQQIGLNATVIEMSQVPWDMLKYNQTYFKPHCDIDRTKNKSSLHVGTQILIPPRKHNQYQQGQLRIFEQNEYIEVLPDQKLWTYVVLPRGTIHEVRNVVNGVRISYRRSFYITPINAPHFDRLTCNTIKPRSKRRKTLLEIQKEKKQKNNQEL